MLQPEQAKQLNWLTIAVAQKRLTQLEVSRVTGVHQSQISRILSGNVRRPSKNVLKLCRYAELLPAIDGTSGGERDGAIAEVVSMLGHSGAEETAFRQVIASLHVWRQTWREPR
jgi:transcriptional regulator with XRE-family HTH domain